VRLTVTGSPAQDAHVREGDGEVPDLQVTGDAPGCFDAVASAVRVPGKKPDVVDAVLEQTRVKGPDDPVRYRRCSSAELGIGIRALRGPGQDVFQKPGVLTVR